MEIGRLVVGSHSEGNLSHFFLFRSSLSFYEM